MTTFLVGWLLSFVAFLLASGIVYSRVKDNRREFATSEIWFVIILWLLSGMLVGLMFYN